MTRRLWLGIALALALAIALPAALAAQVSLGAPVNLGPPVSGEYDEGSPSLTADGLELYYFSDRPGGYGSYDLWVSTRPTTRHPWGPPVNLGPVVNSPALECAPTVSSDGLELIFSDYVLNRPGGVGKTDLWVTRRASRNEPWGKPENLGPLVNSVEDEITPTLSADGLELYIDSYRAGSMGASDLWVARRATRASPWQEPIWLGAALNSAGVEHCPTISADGLTLFFDRTPPGQAEEIGDLMMATRATLSSPWSPAVNLGHTLSTHYAAALSHDGRTLYFTAEREGGLGKSDIWMTELKPAIGSK